MRLIIALVEIFGKHIIVDAFSCIYFMSILKEKWLYFHIEIMISAAHVHAREPVPQREIWKKYAIWCVLYMVYIFDQILH